MKYNLELFYFDLCPYCQLVLSKIKALKIKNVTLSNIQKNPSKLKQLLKDTGRKTVPCLYIDGVPMHESSHIVDWLDKNKSELS